MKYVLLLLAAAWTWPAAAAEPGGPQPAAGGLSGKFQRVFPRLTFERPLFLAAAPGDAQRLYVVEQGGVIRVLEGRDPATTRVFLDLRGKVSRQGEEEGLLGLAFHPQYGSN